MAAENSSPVVGYRLYVRFEDLRQRLLLPRMEERLKKNLAYWALDGDRRLPNAFMSRTLGELLATPFDQLCRTPGVGRKKLGTFLDLLERAATSPDTSGHHAPPEPIGIDGDQFDPCAVSEATWEFWRQTVRRHGLEEETLGRFAASLQTLPRVVWNAPLGNYTRLTLAEIRKLKTHGPKRVRSVVEVFHAVQSLLKGMPTLPHLTVRVVPRFVEKLEGWVYERLGQSEPPSQGDVLRYFGQPILEQVRVDLGETVEKLAAVRLGLAERGMTMRRWADRLGLTRARVYQLLGDVPIVLRVRWPEGESLVRRLGEQLADQVPAGALLRRATELCFPRSELESAGFLLPTTVAPMAEHRHAS
ncbi:MAG: hypothetical protein HYS13_14540 [Planctomycetia bacterium]|nr:hypothetical protein [Planctomycetia bacterium]